MARYELVERIGVGGMAEIYRGKATAGGGFEKPVAIKKILPHLSQDKRFVELLITEAKTLSSLRHRNIVQIFDVGLGDDGQYFIVMEYVEGTDLGALYEFVEKRQRRLPLAVALHVAAEVCEALDHAHRARGPTGEPLGLVHRDVSPSNVLLSRSGEVKLTDFGIAKRTEEVTGHGGVRGKFAYISPEQAHNTHVDGRSDVYSVGIILYELVTGTRLFSDLPDFDALRAVREGRTRRPRDVDPSIDPELDKIVMTALAHEADGRYPSAANFGVLLRSYRYSVVSAAADPAVEISRMVDEMGGRVAAPPVARKPTFVRISTVAGFSGGIELSEESGSGFTGEHTQDRALDDHEEPTHAVRLGQSGGRAGAARLDSEMLFEGETHVASESARADAAVRPPSGEFDLSDAETSVLDYRRPRGIFERFGRSGRRTGGGGGDSRGGGGRGGRGDVVGGLPGTFQTVTPSGDHPPLDRPSALDAGLKSSSVISSAPRILASAAPAGSASAAAAAASPLIDSNRAERNDDRAPTIRRWLRTPRSFAAGRFSGSGTSAAVAGPADSRTPAYRRRTILIASGAAVVVATLTFLFAGTLLGGDSAAGIPDASPPPDAAVTMTMPPEPVEPRPKKKKKKSPPKKKTTKNQKGGKSGKSTKNSKSDKR